MEEFIDVDFQITTNRNAADLEWATDTLSSGAGGTLLGFFFFPSSNGNGGFGVLNNNSSSFPNWNTSPGGTLDTGGFMYGVAVHELGHGLGLAHPHDAGAGTDVMQGVSSSSSRGSFGLNSSPFTAMSYNEGWAASPSGLANPVASTGHGATFGALDIAALQNMYGANTTHASGDDVYTLFDTNTTGSGAGYYATWDTGGIDEFRYTGTKDAFIDLREATLQYDPGGGGYMSHVDGVIAGRTIANGVVIENATSGSGADTLRGNDANNRLVGNAGDDQLIGGGGIDTFAFSFGDGFDSIADFELGTDLIDLRGLGIGFSDLSITQNGGTASVRYDFSTSGQISLTNVSAAALSEADFLLDVFAALPLVGTNGAESIAGTAGDDEIQALGGNDTISALGGNDTVDAGTGDDTIIYTAGKDSIDGGTGSDWLDLTGTSSDANIDLSSSAVIGGVSLTLQNVENLVLANVANTVQDTGENNTILSGTGNDTITLSAGNDSVDGGAGTDTLFLRAQPGSGSDPDFTIDLSAGTATGSNGEVNTFQNIETVVGGGGDDTFSGTSANDTMTGGGGSNVFVFGYGDGLDTIADFAVGTDLIDLRGLAIGFTNLAITDVGGNAQIIYDFATLGQITLTGVTAASLSESDFLLDIASVAQSASGPQISGSSGVDNLAGTNAPEEILGLGGNDVLNGRAGADTLTGGLGDDNYYLDELGDTVVEQVGQGYDRTYSSVSFTLADNVEAGATLGTSSVHISGNALTNWITGNAASNNLNGGAGNDRLISFDGDDRLNGDAGNDVLEGGIGSDIFAFDAGAGTDV
ncbi:MAG: M10 family metallopeptidase C-terminal domain-containing protein, partial [Pseudomonadota bacterium]